MVRYCRLESAPARAACQCRPSFEPFIRSGGISSTSRREVVQRGDGLANAGLKFQPSTTTRSQPPSRLSRWAIAFQRGHARELVGRIGQHQGFAARLPPNSHAGNLAQVALRVHPRQGQGAGSESTMCDKVANAEVAAQRGLGGF